MVFETIGVAWGYVFVIVIAGCSLIIGYYKGKGKIKFATPEKSATETEFATTEEDEGEKKD
ncbi:MAG: hypothetical protein GTN97_05900 [Nitrosopumilaceae archaeon]|nr:hypothetical protein [Nitrosopumilaceae archaeon]